LLGGFFLGMLWRRAIQRDAILGMAVGIIAMSFVVFAKWMMAILPSLTDALTPLSHIAFPWFVLIGTSFTMGVGILSSFTHPAPTDGDRWNE
jgi:Na+/proline symporter